MSMQRSIWIRTRQVQVRVHLGDTPKSPPASQPPGLVAWATGIALGCSELLPFVADTPNGLLDAVAQGVCQWYTSQSHADK